MLVGRSDTGAMRAFFFADGEFVGNDDASTSSSLRVAKAGDERDHAGVRAHDGGSEKVRFELGDGTLHATGGPSRRPRSADLVASHSVMCGRYTLTTPGGRALAERFELADPDALDPATLGRFNVCPTEPIAIVSPRSERAVARTMRWGLVPPWARELGKGFQPINARSETAADKPPFAELLERAERRCLVLADGWYEWLKAEKKGGDRIPFRYTVDDGGPFAFAGLWGRRRIGGELVHSALHPHLRGQRRVARRCTTACRACSPAPKRRRRGWRASPTGCSARSPPSAAPSRPPTRPSTRPASRAPSC